MTQDGLKCPPRVVPVMTKPTVEAAVSLNHAPCSRIRGYGIVSPPPAWLTRFRSTKPFSFSHSTPKTSRRDDAVMTRTPAALTADASSPHKERSIRVSLIAAVSLAVLTLYPPVTRSGTLKRPSAAWLEGALCVHSGWHWTSHRVRGRAPEYVLWGHGFWRTWKLPYGTGSEGEGAWNATSDPRYGGGMSFTLGTWNEAAGYSGGSVPRASSTSEIAKQPPWVQLLAAWLIVSKRGHWGDWPQTSRACGLRR